MKGLVQTKPFFPRTLGRAGLKRFGEFRAALRDVW
jgi:hypothetical protein